MTNLITNNFVRKLKAFNIDISCHYRTSHVKLYQELGLESKTRIHLHIVILICITILKLITL